MSFIAQPSTTSILRAIQFLDSCLHLARHGGQDMCKPSAVPRWCGATRACILSSSRHASAPCQRAPKGSRAGGSGRNRAPRDTRGSDPLSARRCRRATRQTMKAVQVHAFGAMDAMIYEDVPLPVPGPGQVLVRVAATGVGPWDAWIREGRSVLPQPLPLVLGADLSGVVAAIAVGLQRW
jgi:hypothetical protein